MDGSAAYDNATRAPERATTRAGLFRSAAVVGGSLGCVALVDRSFGSGASAKTSGRQDVEILNFLLLVEYVQEAFYNEALRKGSLTGALRVYATTVAPQETEHVQRLRRRLGGNARGRPQFAFGDKTQAADAFRDAAVRLEELGVAAYIGQGANLTTSAVAEAARIVSVEARQAAWIRSIAGENPAPHAADPAQSPKTVAAALRAEGFMR